MSDAFVTRDGRVTVTRLSRVTVASLSRVTHGDVTVVPSHPKTSDSFPTWEPKLTLVSNWPSNLSPTAPKTTLRNLSPGISSGHTGKAG